MHNEYLKPYYLILIQGLDNTTAQSVYFSIYFSIYLTKFCKPSHAHTRTKIFVTGQFR